MFNWFRRNRIKQPNPGSKRCDVAGCEDEACFFITWAENRKCVKKEDLCDEHARMALTSSPPDPRPRPIPSRSTQDAMEVDVEFVVVTSRYPEQCIYLRDPNESCHVPILTGYCEAVALSHQLKVEPVSRPLTHDAMALIVKTLGGAVDEIFIDRLDAGVYHANVTLIQATSKRVVDIRPSDAIILAVIFQCPIMFNKELWKTASSLKSQ
jgi:uncharacterized protein